MLRTLAIATGSALGAVACGFPTFMCLGPIVLMNGDSETFYTCIALAALVGGIGGGLCARFYVVPSRPFQGQAPHEEGYE
jgi:hypothetical protein